MTREFLTAGFSLALAVAAIVISTMMGPRAALAAEDYIVQLASVQSEDAARGEWARLQKVHPDLLGDMALDLQSTKIEDRGVFYRIRTGPFPNKATAQDMCWQLKAVNLPCLVLRKD